MIQGPIDWIFFTFAAVVMGITAIKPEWTIYALTYGRPEKAKGQERGWQFVRIIAGLCFISLVWELSRTAYRALGL